MNRSIVVYSYTHKESDMAKTVFNKEKVDFTKQNMFFGADHEHTEI